MIVDLIIVVCVLLACFGGWRQGAFSSILSSLGVIAGLIIGIALSPFMQQLTEEPAIKFLLVIGTLVLLIGLGNMVGGVVGGSLRNNLKLRRGLKIDSAIGAVFQAIMTLLVAWLISVPLLTVLSGQPAEQIRESRVLGFLDRQLPDSLAGLPNQLSAMLDESGLPPLVSPFVEGTQAEVDAPAIYVEDTALIERLRPSVIHVMGEAQACSRRLMGSGFMIDEDYVITNAHVVAGTNSVTLDTVTGMHNADVVYYNPDLDIAVLYSPDVSLPVLPWADGVAATGDDAIVMGFPESGPFEAAPARVADMIRISGPNIYATTRVEREAYAVRGSIRQGNSGGPMVNAEGQILGVVFGASVDNSDIGYVLSAAEVRNAIGDYTQLTAPVDTQQCVAS
ncbi:MAG: MarP family serine protease [Corynebacterium sp.]|nr:MarP family serine protease [Corynebacterium sp.]